MIKAKINLFVALSYNLIEIQVYFNSTRSKWLQFLFNLQLFQASEKGEHIFGGPHNAGLNNPTYFLCGLLTQIDIFRAY